MLVDYLMITVPVCSATCSNVLDSESPGKDYNPRIVYSDGSFGRT